MSRNPNLGWSHDPGPRRSQGSSWGPWLRFCAILWTFGVLMHQAMGSGLITRRFPPEALEGDVIEVVLQAEPLVSALAFGAREILPEGVEYVSSEPEANYTPGLRQLRWGLFFDGRSRTLKYRIRLGAAGTVAGWRGWLDEDGTAVPAAGPATLEVRRPSPGKLTRSLPATVETESVVVVQLAVRPSAGIQFQVVEEIIPEGWKLVDASGGGLMVSESKLRWGPWTDDEARDLTYRLQAPARKGAFSWSGLANLGDQIVDTGGSTGTEVITKSVGEVLRSVPDHYSPGVAVAVRLVVKPPALVGLYVVEENIPVGWTLGAADSGGRLDASGKLVWGVFSGGDPQALNYTVIPPADAMATAFFSGLARFDSVPVNTTGASEVSLKQLAKPKAVRTLPAEYTPGLAFRVEVTAQPVAGSTLYLVEEDIPAGCDVESAELGGQVTNGRLSWGPFLDDQPRTFSYRLVAAAGTRGALTLVGRIRSSQGETVTSGDQTVSERPPKSGRIEQTLPPFFLPGIAFTVKLSLMPESGVAIHLLSQSIPDGWSVGAISGGGRWDDSQRRVVWGLYTDDQSRSLTVEVFPPASARGVYSMPCEAVFDGLVRRPTSGSGISANLPPELSIVPAQTVAEDEVLTLRVRASDPELSAELLSLSVAVEPSDLFPPADRSVVRQGKDVVLTLRPAAEAAGSAVVKLSLSDDVQTTRSQFDVTVLPVNDAPSITNPTSVFGAVEDSSMVRLEGIRISDPDLGDGPLEVELEAASGAEWLERPIPAGVQRLASTNRGLLRLRGTLGPVNEALSQIGFRPAPDFFGTQRIQVRANDLGSSGPGGPQTGVRDLSMEILGINDPPGFRSLAGVVLSVDEDAPASSTSFPGFLKEVRVGPTNEISRQLVLLQVSADNPSLFSVQPRIDAASGRLQFTLTPDASGETWVQVQAVDNGGVAGGGVDRGPVDRFLLRVEAVNDAPALGLPVSVSGAVEDSPLVTVRGLRVTDKDAAGQSMDVTLELDSDAVWLERPLPPGLQRVSGSEGVLRWLGPLDPLNRALDELTFRPAPDFFGTLTVRLTVNDLGAVGKGGARSGSVVFTVGITPVNDAPTFEPLPDQAVVSVDEDAPASATVFGGFLKGLRAGPTNELAAQSLAIELTVGNPGLFSQLPQISPAGALSFTVKPQAWGESRVAFQAVDTGGTANGGSNRSPTNTFLISVQSLNDPPQVTLSTTNLTVVGSTTDDGIRQVPGWVRSVTVGPADEVAAGQKASIIVTSDRIDAFRSPPVVNRDGDLSLTLVPYWSGVLNLTVIATDDGPSNPPNQSSAPPIQVRLQVVSENQPPAVVWSEGWEVPAPAPGQTFILPGVYPGLTEAFTDELDPARTTAEWISDAGGTVAVPVIAYRSGRRSDFAGLAGLELGWSLSSPPVGSGRIRLVLADLAGVIHRFEGSLRFVGGPGPRLASGLPPAGSVTDPATGLPVTTLQEDAPPLSIDLSKLLVGATGTVRWSLQQPLPTRVVDAEIRGSTLWILPRPDRSGSEWVQLRATADNGQVSWAFKLDVLPVADPPQIEVPGVQLLTEGMLWTTALRARSMEFPGRPVVFRLEGAPAGLQMRPDGWLSWSPSELQGPGDFSADVVVQDQTGGPESRATLRFSVAETNSPPLWRGISDVVLREGSPLQTSLSASDSDLPAQKLVYRSVEGPIGMGVSAEGLLTWTPSEAQGPGTHVLSVAVSDGVVSVTNRFTVVVREVNEPPKPVAVPDQVLDENARWAWKLAASDGDIPVQSLSYGLASGPDGMSVGPDGLLEWTPSEVQGPGEFQAFWWVSDGVASTTNRIRVQVREVNSAPRLDPANDLRVVEGYEMRSRVLGVDADIPAQPLRFRLVSGPVGFSLSPEGLAVWRPGESQAPSSSELWIAVNDGVVWSTNRMVVEALELNETPIVEPLPELTGVAGFELQALVKVRDIDLPPQRIDYRLLQAPDGMVIRPDGGLSWRIPTNQPAGRYNLRVRVSDGLEAADVQTVVVVKALNLPPVIAPVGDLDWTENLLQRKQLVAVDPGQQGPGFRWTLVQGPPGLFLSPSGLLEWTPDEDLGGSAWQVTVMVSNGNLTSAQAFKIRVLEDNVAPAWSGETRRTIQEREPLVWNLPVSDSDQPSQSLVFRRLSGPDGWVIQTNGIVTWTPSEIQGPGIHAATFAVSDGMVEVTNTVEFVVLESNENPVTLLDGPVSVPELSPAAWKVTVSDSDLPQQQLVWSLVSAPDGLTLSTNGVVKWTPREDQGPGIHPLVLAVSDGFGWTTNRWELRVTEVNQAPVPDPIEPAIVVAGSTWQFQATARDADWPLQVLTSRLLDGPLGMTMDDRGLIRWTPPPQAVEGIHPFRVEWSDGEAFSQASGSIRVKALPKPPVILPIPTLTWSENATNSLRLRAESANPSATNLVWSLIDGPPGLTLSRSGELKWCPDERSGGADWAAVVSVNDGDSSAVAAVSIRVVEDNQPPALAQEPRILVRELEQMVWFLKVVDPDIPVQRLVFERLSGPAGLTVSSEGVVAWTPPSGTSLGTNPVVVVISDGLVSVTNRLEVIVGKELNVPPVWIPAGTRRVSEGLLLAFLLKAVDANQPPQPLTYSLIRGPAGLTVTPAGLVTWRPSESQGPDTHPIEVGVSDGFVTVSQVFQIVVMEANQPPVWPQVATQGVDEGSTLSFVLQATDPDIPSQSLAYRLVEGPEGMEVAANGLLSWRPTEVQGPATNRVTVSATDGISVSVQSFDIVVNEVNRPPVWVTAAATRRVSEGAGLGFMLKAVDADDPPQRLSYRVDGGPTGLLVRADGWLSWSPTEAQGPSTNRVRVSVSDGVATVPLEFDIVVNEVNRPPVWVTAAATRRVSEGAGLGFMLKAVDADDPPQRLSYRVDGGPTGLLVRADGWLSWSPTEAQGPSTNRVRVSVSDGVATVPLEFDIVVNEVNQAPVWATVVGTRRVNEGALLTFPVAATDADVPAQPLTYRLVSAPWGLTLSAQGVVSWRPTEIQGPSTNRVRITVGDGIATVPLEFDVVVRDAITGSPGPTLSLSPRSDGSWTLRVAGIGGGRYQVEQQTRLDGKWIPVPGVSEVLTEGPAVPTSIVLPANAAPGLFIRLRGLE